MREFNEEFAKNGDPVEIFSGNNWIDAHFLGKKKNGAIVVEVDNILFQIMENEGHERGIRMKVFVQ